jgi:hypothetical protein
MEGLLQLMAFEVLIIASIFYGCTGAFLVWSEYKITKRFEFLLIMQLVFACILGWIACISCPFKLTWG